MRALGVVLGAPRKDVEQVGRRAGDGELAQQRIAQAHRQAVPAGNILGAGKAKSIEHFANQLGAIFRKDAQRVAGLVDNAAVAKIDLDQPGVFGRRGAIERLGSDQARGTACCDPTPPSRRAELAPVRLCEP